MTITRNIDFIKSLSPLLNRFFTSLGSHIKEYPALTCKASAKALEEATVHMNLDRLICIQNLKERTGYNPLELIECIETAAKELGHRDASQTDRALAVESLKCLDFINININAPYEALYNCLTNQQIDSDVRVKTIKGLVKTGTTKVFEVLKDCRKLLERDKSDPARSELIKELNHAIKKMQEKEI